MKKELRSKYLTVRNTIKSNKLDKEIFNRVITNEHIINCNLLLVYVSYNSEVDTINIIKYFLGKKIVAVPKIENNIMNFYLINSLSDLKEGTFGILEPISNKIVTEFTNTVSITPGICFSKEFYRIGYGKGFYDKFYSMHNNIYKIGLTYDECLIDTFTYDNFDKPLDEIITPTKILVKSNKK